MTPQMAREREQELRQLLASDPEADARFLAGKEWLHWVPSVWYKPWTWNLSGGKWIVRV